jgi:hypothetical protein
LLILCGVTTCPFASTPARRRSESRRARNATIARLHADHPFVGQWIVEGEQGGVEYSIAATAQGFRVTGVDQRDGEVLDVSNARWADGALCFSVHVRSKGYRVEHVLRLRDDGTVEDRFTATFVDVLTRTSPRS